MKRLLAAFGALLAAICLFVCLAALDFVWSVKQPVIEKSSAAFQKADGVLALADRTIVSIRHNLNQSRAHMLLVNTTTSVQGEQPGVIERTMARTIARQVSPSIASVQNSLERVTEASIVVNSLLESLNEIDDLEHLNTEQVRSLQSNVDGVTKASWELNEMLDDPRYRKDSESPHEKSARIAANLGEIIQMADNYQATVIALRKKLHHYRDKSLFWMQRGPTLASIVLAWIMISQLAVIVVAIRFLQRRTHGKGVLSP